VQSLLLNEIFLHTAGIKDAIIHSTIKILQTLQDWHYSLTLTFFPMLAILLTRDRV